MEEITLYIVAGYHHDHDDEETPNVRRKFYANKKISEAEILEFFHRKYRSASRYTCFWIEERIPLLVQKKPEEKNPL